MSQNFNRDSQPNKVATEVNQYIKLKTGCEDAYYKQKETSIKLPRLVEVVDFRGIFYEIH
jgi:uncharacterized protein with ATP-grasp and redox domains